MKKICVVWCVLLSMLAARAEILLMDSSNYPYANGLIAGQGQWYIYYPKTPKNDCFVTNNVIILNTSHDDSPGTPTNGWVNSSGYTYVSFEINVTKLPSLDGGYFAQLQNDWDTNDCCHVFVDTLGTTVPGTYRLGIANFSTSFSNVEPPHDFPMDLALNTTYTVVILFDTLGDTLSGATLWINPSENDWDNAYLDLYSQTTPGIGIGGSYAYGTDVSNRKQPADIGITQFGLSTYVNAGISNVIAATTFPEVNLTNFPVWGIQPQSQTNYAGNSTTFYAVASAVDVTYQWYSTTYGALSDGPSFGGATFVGSESNTLAVSNFSASDTYYCVASDAYNNSITTTNAVNTVITTPTAPFFTATPANLTNNVFTTAIFTNIAFGTGPLSYQWYFAPTNSGIYSPLTNQTSPVLILTLSDFTYEGTYYVTASNSVNGGSIANGPTNSITEIAPTTGTISQLHALMISYTNEIAAGTPNPIIINSNNVSVSGYVSQYQGYGSTYTTFYIQDASGLGMEVYLAHDGNTNAPPIGTYVTVKAPIEIDNGSLEMTPTTNTSIKASSAAAITLPPRLENSIFNDLATNAAGTNALTYDDSLVTFTNVYIYASPSGAPLDGETFYAGGYTEAYITVGGPYSVATGNTNTMELFQPAYNFGTNTAAPNYLNPFDNVAIPTNCYQLTGVYDIYYSGELVPSRVPDYVINPPQAPAIGIAESNGVPTLTGSSLLTGSTYSVQAATNLTGPWVTKAYGLSYWPTNATFTDTNAASAKYYLLSSP